MDENSEQTSGAVTRENSPTRQSNTNQPEASKKAKIPAKKAKRSGKMSYVTKLINNVNKQVAEDVEPGLLDFNIQSLKKAMTSFTNFNEEYVANLDDAAEIERAFMTLLNIEDNSTLSTH
eukprot:gene2706-3128_t